MKKLVAGALALALGFSAFAQDAHELVGSAGKISFGAWGRSTFNIGANNSSTKIDVSTKISNDAYGAAVYGQLTATGSNDLKKAADQVIETDENFAPLRAAGITTVDALVAAMNAGIAGTADAFTGLTTAMAMNAAVRAGIDATALNTLAGMGVKNTDESDVEWYAELAPDWSYGCRVGFWIIGRTTDERWGFDFNLDSDAAALFVGAQNYDSTSAVGSLKTKNGGLSYAESGKYAVAIGDQAKIWGIFDFNPIDLKVAFGKMREQELRGSIGDFGQRESSDVRSEDDIFTEMWPVMGLFVSAKGQEGTALEGLYAAVDCDAFGLISDKAHIQQSFLHSLLQFRVV